MKLWSGRISSKMDPLAAQLNTSLPVDQRLAAEDVMGSIAWAGALGKTGVFSPEEAIFIRANLEIIQSEFKNDEFPFTESDEDIHTAVERRLTELAGPLAGKLHTGRSRNDQVATDFRLWTVSAGEQLDAALHELQAALVERAETDFNVLFPGYTHFQQAQPLLISHWWLSHFWPLQRDRERLQECLQRTRISPLGSGALAGTTYPINRFSLAQEIGFNAPCSNSLDGVSDRDFAAEFLFGCTMTALHLSRLAEALILYSTAEFGYVTLNDAYSTGSSLMPQKKNPDPLELIRAKSGELTGRLAGLLATLKGLPSAYDKDLQEDKAAVFDAFDRMMLCLPVMAGILRTLKIHPERMLATLNPAILATDLADYLVARGIPFRKAHAIVAQSVSRAETLGVSLNKMPLAEWKNIHSVFDSDLFAVFDPMLAVQRRSAYGGDAPRQVQAQLLECKKLLSQE